MRLTNLLTILIGISIAVGSAVFAAEARPRPAQAIPNRPSTFWTRLWEIVFAKPTRNDPPNEIKPHSMGGDHLSIAGVSPRRILYIPQSDANLIIPWHSPSDNQIIVTRRGEVIARAEGKIGSNQLIVVGGRSQLGNIDVEIALKRPDGSLAPLRYVIMVVDPAGAPALPADAKKDGVSERVLTATYWSAGYNFCFYSSQNPVCGRWRLAAYQDWLAIRSENPDERDIADYFIEEMNSGI